MKGLLVKSKDKISKAGIPQNGVGLVGNILGIVVRLGALVVCGCPMRCIWYGTEECWKSGM